MKKIEILFVNLLIVTFRFKIAKSFSINLAEKLLVIAKKFKKEKNKFLLVDLVLMLGKILSKGDFVVQGGANLKGGVYDSQLIYISRIIGKDGTILVVEPSLENIHILNDYIDSGVFNAHIIIVNKGLFSSAGVLDLVRANDGDNEFISTYGLPEVAKQDNSHSGTVAVKIDALDHILKDLDIETSVVRYINLTINGCEFEALKGMTKVLSEDKLCLTVIAGREDEGEIGYIDGENDHVVISKLLQSYGFRASFVRFKPGHYGYVVAAKKMNIPPYV